MNMILQNRKVPRGHLKDSVCGLCSFQAIRRRSLTLVGLAGFCTVESGQRKVHALSGKTKAEQGGVGPA